MGESLKAAVPPTPAQKACLSILAANSKTREGRPCFCLVCVSTRSGSEDIHKALARYPKNSQPASSTAHPGATSSSPVSCFRSQTVPEQLERAFFPVLESGYGMHSPSVRGSLPEKGRK